MLSRKHKVYVGLSGGVDSSVTAALLKERGFDVTGVFIKVWNPDWMECSWKEDRRDAMRVCAALGIPFKTLDLESEYKKEVVDYMLAEYAKGRTPNPDVMCNRYVKFGGFLKWALSEGADYIATGHYVQLENENLFRAKDANKDQSYFLWTLTKEDLAHCLFPIGALLKSEVRKLAEQFRLPTAEKKDSQGLCFIGKVDMKEFLSHYIDTKPGSVISESGETIGSHDGAIFYTIGQRQGFTVNSKTPLDKPYYIVSKDMQANTITVSHAEPQADPDHKETIVLEKVNWIAGKPKNGKLYECRARYRQALVLCTISTTNKSEWTVKSEKPLGGAPGQSLVIYEGDRMVGGGIISNTV